MFPYISTHFGSPLSLNRDGAQARLALDTAHEEIAGLINAEAEEIILPQAARNRIMKALEAQL